MVILLVFGTKMQIPIGYVSDRVNSQSVGCSHGSWFMCFIFLE